MKFIFIVWAALLPLLLCSQKQGNVWCFGNQAGLNFNSGAPVTFTGSQTGTGLMPGQSQEGTASISDSSGFLLFYTNGQTIWNRKHQVMLNGSGILGGVSSTQAALIVPQPGNDSLFYVFTSDEFQSYPGPLKGYRYSVVDMCLDSTKGAVIAAQKNILLADSATEKLSACLDAAGTGYWILGHRMYSNLFHAWHLTSAGITSTVISGTGMVHGFWPNNPNPWVAGMAQGQMKFNPQGNRIGLVHGNYQPATVELFDFNNGNGVVSNPCRIVADSAMMKSPYGLEFSSDGSKLYIDLSGGSGGNRLHQYDLNAGSCAAVRSSGFLIFQSSVNNPPLQGMQMATDSKIYIVAGNNLASINAPTLPGTASNFNPVAVGGATFNNTYSLPSFIAGYEYISGRVPCVDYLSTSSSSSVLCAGEQVTLTVSGATSYTWSNGVVGTSITVSPNSTTSYTITGYGNGMANVSTVITQSVVACTGLRQVQGNSTIYVFPNPSSGQIQVESPVNIDLVEVMDQFGKVVYRNKPGELQHKLIIHGTGIFIMKIQTGGRIFRQKLLIENE